MADTKREITITIKADSADAEKKAERIRTALSEIDAKSGRVSGTARETAETIKRIGDVANAAGRRGSDGLASLLISLNLLDRGVSFLTSRFRDAMQYAFDVDSARTQITAIVGSAAEATRKMDELRRLAATSVGVTAKSAFEAFSQFKAAGNIADETINRLIKSIGRLNAAFSIPDVAQFQRNLLQIFSQGFEIQDVKEALGQVPIFRQLIKQAFGTDDPETLKALKESGKLTLESWLNGLATAIESNESLSRIEESLTTRWAKAGQAILTTLEPLSRALLGVIVPALELMAGKIGPLLPAILGLAAAVTALRLAWLLMNTQIFVTAATQIPQAIAALKLMAGAMVSLQAATSSLGMALGVSLGWLTVIGAVVGVAYLAWSQYNSAAERANEITNDSIKSNSEALQNLIALKNEAAAVAAAQTDSAERHEKLNLVLGKLEPATRAYIESLKDQQQQIYVLNQELERNIAARRSEMEAQLRIIAEGILKQTADIEEAIRVQQLFQQKINDAQAVMAQSREIFGDRASVESAKFIEAQAAASRYSNALVDAAENQKNLQQGLDSNQIKLVQLAQSLGLNSEQLREFFIRSGYAATQAEQLAAAAARVAAGQQQLAENTNKTALAIGDLTKRLRELTDQTDTKINDKIADIVLNSKTRAEAIAKAREARSNEEVRALLEQSKSLAEREKAVRETFGLEKSSNVVGPRPTNVKRPTTGNALFDSWINRYSQEYKIDPMLIFAQMQQESSFRKGAVSYKGARGLMQVMPKTFAEIARRYPGRFTNINDPRQNIEAGILYLSEQLAAFDGDLKLALAAYNAGPEAVRKYGGRIPPYAETKQYVKRIMTRYAGLSGETSGFAFDPEQIRQEISDEQTRAYNERITQDAINFYRQMGLIPDGNMLNRFEAFFKEEARKSGIRQPTTAEIRSLFEREKINRLRDEVTTSGEISDSITPRQTLDEQYISSLKESLRIEERTTALVMERRNATEVLALLYQDKILKTDEEILRTEQEIDLLKRTSASQAATESRRRLQALQEEAELRQQIQSLEDAIARDSVNDHLALQVEYLRTILDLRNREREAAAAIIRAEIEISRQMQISTTEIKAAVLDNLARQRSLNQAIADGINQTYEQIAGKLDEQIDKMFRWAGVFKSLFTEPLKAIARDGLTRITAGLLDTFIPGLGSAYKNATVNPIAKPVVEELQTTNKLLSQLVSATGQIPAGGGLGSLSNILGGLGSITASGNINSRLIAQSGLSHLETRTQSTSIIDRLRDLFGTGENGIFRPRKNILTGQNSRMAGYLAGAGELAAIAGSLIGGRAGSAISMAGMGLSFGAMFGHWGAAIGAGVGALLGFLGFSDPKRKEDKNVNLPNLNKGFSDALRELNEILSNLRSLSIDPDEAIRRANEIRGQIAAGFGIEFKSKKYRKQAQQLIQAKLMEADRLIDQIKQAAEIARGAADRSKRILPEFAGGHYFADYFRPNGLIPGVFDARDNILALISRGEMVLNPRQQNRIRALAGYDVFAHAGIPNYPKPNASNKFASGGIVGKTHPIKETVPNFTIVLSGVTFNENAAAWLESDDGKRSLIKLITDHNRGRT